MGQACGKSSKKNLDDAAKLELEEVILSGCVNKTAFKSSLSVVLQKHFGKHKEYHNVIQIYR